MIGSTTETERIAGAEGLALIGAWRNMERDRKRPLGGAVDFYTIDPSEYLNPAISRQLTRVNSRPRFISLLGEITHKFNSESRDGRFAQARERGLNVYIDASTGKRTSRYRDLAVYAEDAMDLPVGSPVAYTMIPQEHIDGLRERTRELYVKAGGGVFDRDGWPMYARELEYDEPGLRREYFESEEKFRPIFKRMSGVEEDPKADTIFESVPNVTWVNWTKMDIGSNTLKINTHPDVRYRWFPGAIEHLITHELGGHLYEGQAWRERILAGEANPMYGATTIPGPEQWHAEGFANTVPFFNDELYEEMSPQGQFAVHLRLLTTWVQRNAQIMANEEPENMVKLNNARNYIMENLPHMPLQMVNRFLDSTVNNAYSRAYNMAYGGSYEHFQYAHLLRGLTRDWPFPSNVVDLRPRLIARFMSQPLEPMEIHGAVQELVQSKKVA